MVIHLGRKAEAPYFIKIGQSHNHVPHVTLLRTAKNLRTIIPFLREAFDLLGGRPFDLDEIDGLRLAYTKVNAQITL